MVTCIKRLKKAISIFILIFCILFQSLYFNPKKVDAALPAATAIAGYVISVIGAIDMGTGGGVRQIASDLRSSLQNKVADLMGTGIYEDANGDIVFSGEATQQLYNVLMGSGAYNAITVSNFPINSNTQPPSVPYNPAVWLDINSTIQSLSHKMVFYGNNISNQNDVLVCDVSNVGFVTVQTNNSFQPKALLNFYNSSGQSVSVPMTKWTIYGTSESARYKRTGQTNQVQLSSSTPLNDTDYYNIINNTSINDYSSSNLDLLANFNYNYIYCNKSLIVANNVNNAITMNNKNTGVTVNNYFSEIPKVSTSVVENNNWNSIYNNYIQNIQNNSETYIDNSGQIDIDELRKVMERYGNQIIDAVYQGVENIQEFINLTNQWLERIYNLLDEINQKLSDDDGSGGGTVSGSTVDLSTIESYLQSLNTSVSAMQQQCTYIANNLPNNEQQLTQIYTVLQNIYQSLQNIPSGGSPTDPNSDPYAPWYPKFFAIPDSDILDTIGQIEIIETLLQGLVPLCYITGIGAVVNALGTQPVTPVFTIPLEFSNDYISVDEDIEIDLSPFDDLRDIVTGGMVILFMLTLGYFTIWLLKFLLDILSKS